MMQLAETTSYTDLNSIREKIEVMPKFNQVEVLRILSKDTSITLNENNPARHFT